MRRAVAALALALACVSPSGAMGGGLYDSSATASSHTATPSWVHRDSHGKIARDPRQLNAFKKQNPCPATGKTFGSCPGYVVDHIIPLKRGGPDSPSNMQWQTKEAAKEKDKWE
jgi:hypothetical protein